MFIVRRIDHRFRPPNLISRVTPMKNLIKPNRKRSNEGYFTTAARDLMRVPGKPIFSFAKSWAEISNYIINSVIKLVGGKTCSADEI